MMRNHGHIFQEGSSNRGARVLRIVGLTLAGIAAACAFALVFGLVVKWLWNWLMPAVFGLGTITYWQAFGILVLSKLLFGAFHRHGHDRHAPFSRAWREGRRDFPGSAEAGHPFPEDMHRHARHYHDFWRREGRDAFDAYVRRVEGEADDKPGE